MKINPVKRRSAARHRPPRAESPGRRDEQISERLFDLRAHKSAVASEFDAGEDAAASVVLDRGNPHLKDVGDLLGGEQLVEQTRPSGPRAWNCDGVSCHRSSAAVGSRGSCVGCRH